MNVFKKYHKLFFISTNDVWGGSEQLWHQSALQFLKEGYKVSLAVKYYNEKVDQLKSELSHLINMNNRFRIPSLIKRVANKFCSSFDRQDRLKIAIETFQPELVIISQGNSISSVEMMEFCIEKEIRFVIISQIVTDLSWFWLDDVSRLRLVNAFEKAEKCYFVSQNNLKLHNFLLTYEALNSELIYNPFKRDGSSAKFDYPINRFQVAIVGRLECYHKGLDILIRIITEKKWQDREVNFNFYGSGPHAQMIENLFKKLGIKNAFLKGFSSDIIDLWKNNHILLQPSRMEGQSLALLEATNLGRAAIATNVGGVAEIITDNVTGFIAETATIRDLDDAMERAWERRGEWESIGVAAYDKFREVYPADPVSFFNTKIVSLLDAPTS